MDGPVPLPSLLPPKRRAITPAAPLVGIESLAQADPKFNAVARKFRADARAGTERLNALTSFTCPSRDIVATTLPGYRSPVRWLRRYRETVVGVPSNVPAAP